MALLPPNVDYTDKDFDSIRARLINLIRSAFPDWTDFNIANFGNILLDLYAFTGDVLTFYQDNQSKESRISTAKLRSSMLGLSKLINYKPQGAVAAQTDLTFTLSEAAAGNVTIEAGDTFQTLEITDPLVFQALSQVVIPAGTLTTIFTVEHSEPATDTFVSSNVVNQEFLLPSTPFIDDSLVIVANNGLYTEVDNFLSSTSADKHFTVTVDENDRATVRFGNGVNGAIPVGTINVSYKVGGGADGNVDPNTIRKLGQQYADEFGSGVQVSVTNQNKATGGDDRKTTEFIRVNAPRSLRTLNRTVSREDYENNALKVPGVARAVMLTSNEKLGVLENQGDLHIVPNGGGLPSQDLKDAVLEIVTVTYPNTLTFAVTVKDPDYLVVNIETVVFFSGTPTTVAAAIRTNLTNYFALYNADGGINEDIGFGYQIDEEIPLSTMRNVIRDSVGVRKISDVPNGVTVNGSATDLDVDTFQFPTLGTVTIINAETGAIVT